MEKYLSEFSKLVNMMMLEGIPFRFNTMWDGYQLHYEVGGREICDVICHSGSYGSDHDLLEMMGLTPEDYDDTVRGYLTANEAFGIILEHWDAYNADLPRHEGLLFEI